MFVLNLLGVIIKAALAIGFVVLLIVSGLFEWAFLRAIMLIPAGVLALCFAVWVWIEESIPDEAGTQILSSLGKRLGFACLFRAGAPWYSG